MEGSKAWYFSRTVWASIVTVAAAIAGMAGTSIGVSDQALMTETVLQLVTAGAGMIAIVGRLRASARIG